MSAQANNSPENSTPTRPIITVGGLIFNHMGEALFVRTHKWHNKYGLPGGKVDLGESLEQAFRREIREETALEVSDIEFICVQESVFSAEFYKPMHMVLLNFQATVHSNDIYHAEPILNDEAQEYVWLTLENALEQIEMNHATQNLIRIILERRPAIAKPTH